MGDKISIMPENTPESHKPALSHQERVEEAEQSTQNSFDQYKGSKRTERWMWIVGIAVVLLNYFSLMLIPLLL